MTYIIAEIGVNHNGSIEEALTLIHRASEAKVDAVKFQKRDLEALYSSSILEDSNSAEWNFDYLIPMLKDLELSPSDYKRIEAECSKLDLDLIITPMDEKSAEFISTLNLAAIKISSADMTNLGLICKCASFKLPLIISTGMWEYEDIKSCSDFFKKKGFDFSLLLSNSTYPTPYESISLGFLETLKGLAPRVGYSGHERGTFIPCVAVSMGAEIIEKHITLDRLQKGPDHQASLLPHEFSQMVKDIRHTSLSLSTKKHVNQAETLNKQILAKSTCALSDIPIGSTLSKDLVEFRSPGKGIFPHEINKYYGRVLKNNIRSGAYISSEDFENITPINKWNKFNFSKRWGVKCRFHDYLEYKHLESPVIEFHCSETDLNIRFNESNNDSELIVHAPEIMDRELVDICSTDSMIVERSLNIIQRSIDKTLEIAKKWPKAKPKMVVHLGGMSLDLLPPLPMKQNEKMLSLALHNFNKLDFSPDDIDVIPENLPPRPWYLGGQWYQYAFAPPEDMIRFCEETGLKMTYDICHAKLWCSFKNTSLSEYTKKVMPYVSHMHISDATGISGEGIQIFDGEIDFIKTLKGSMAYDFSWVTEIWSGHLHNGSGSYEALQRLDSSFGRKGIKLKESL